MEEDRRTQRALDELADLFLTDSSVDADCTQPDREQADEAELSHAPGAPYATTDTSALDDHAATNQDAFHEELVGPEPVRLSPKLPHPDLSTPHANGSASPPHTDQNIHADADDMDTDVTDETDEWADGFPDEQDAQDVPPLRLHRDGEEVQGHGMSAQAGTAPTNGQAFPGVPDAVETAVDAAIRRGQRRSTAPHATVDADDAASNDPALTTASHASARDAAGRPRQLQSTETGIRTEAVLMGNLPGLSGPWLTQYAQLLAQHLGTVVLLHVDDQSIDVELIEPTDRPQSSGRVPPKHQSQDLIEKLDRLMQPGPAQVQAVLIHSEASNRPVAMQRLKAVDRWTMLCGADDAAIIGGYRLVKSLVEADPAVARKHLGVMVVGSDHDVGRAAAEKLGTSTRPLLDAPAEFVGCQRQMVPVHLRQLGRFGPTATLWPRVAAWLADLAAEPAPMEASLTVSETTTAVNPPDLEATTPPDPEPADFAAAEQEDDPTATAPGSDQFNRPEQLQWAAAAASDAEHTEGEAEMTRSDWTWLHKAGAVHQAPRGVGQESAHQPAGQEPATPAPQEPASAATSQTSWRDRASHPEAMRNGEPGVSDLPDLATFLTAHDGAAAGGVALEAYCPHQPRTQIVLDQQGQLHLLRRHNSTDSTAQPQRDTDDSLRSAILDLIEARKWVREHLELLQLTQRQCRFDSEAAPILHLFTDRADLATGLVARLGDMLRLHLLQQVRIGDQTTWVCTPLH